MARTPSRNPRKTSARSKAGIRGNSAFGNDGGDNAGGAGQPGEPQPTGRYLITYREGAEAAGAKAVHNALGAMHVMATADFAGSPSGLEMAGADSMVLSELGIAIVSAPIAADAGAIAALATDSAIEAIEPEFYIETIAQLKSAMAHEAEATEATLAFADSRASTWGLAATRVTGTRYTGAGIRVAVLDTGLDLTHPDFAGRTIVTASFVPGVTSVQDGHSHGTHCIGTALGPSRPPRPPGVRRYGCAPGADIYVGKVLNDAGGGMAGEALLGIDWAVRNRCEIVSMSLGWRVSPTHPDSVAFESAASRGLVRGTLVIAAAGNEGLLGMRSPANLPSVLAVAAVDKSLSTAVFSSRGNVDIAGPGVGIFSTVPMPGRYDSKDGTSMACPHVAGIAALWAESNSTYRGAKLARILMARARPLPFPADQVGKGLVQAP